MTAAPTGERSSAHVPALDGVRGVAILLVLATHAFPVPLAAGGWLGVDVFFVLSGFLITGILLDTRGKPGFYGSFYVRRALRIWPLYLLVVGALAATARWLPTLAPHDADDFARFAPWIWTQTINLRSALWGGVPVSPYSVGVYWSLGVEEQFYLAWPLLVALVASRRLVPLCLALAVGSVALRLAGMTLGASYAALNVLPITHLEGLALGSALAAALRTPGLANRLASQVAGVAARPLPVVVVSIGILLAASLTGRGATNRDGWLALELVGTPLASLVTAVVVAAIATAGSETPLARAASTSWLRWVGRVSYGLYVWHVPVFFFVRLLAPTLPTLAFASVAIPITAGLAWASWRWWEQPWLSLKRHAPRPVAAEDGRLPDATTVRASA